VLFHSSLWGHSCFSYFLLWRSSLTFFPVTKFRAPCDWFNKPPPSFLFASRFPVILQSPPTFLQKLSKLLLMFKLCFFSPLRRAFSPPSTSLRAFFLFFRVYVPAFPSNLSSPAIPLGTFCASSLFVAFFPGPVLI